MSPRTVTLPPDDPKMWRRLVARAHLGGGMDGYGYARIVDPRVRSRRRERGVREPAEAGS